MLQSYNIIKTNCKAVCTFQSLNEIGLKLWCSLTKTNRVIKNVTLVCVCV